jgi:putative transcriptional regulator
MQENHFFKNKLLIAMPGLDDINFHQAVIYVEEHNEDGAIGIIINKPIELNVQKLLTHLGIESHPDAINENPIYMGGPIAQDQGFVLHEEKKSSLMISTSKDTLIEIGQGKGPQEFIITLGYSEWDAGQLEKEVLNNDWLVAPYSSDIILRTPPAHRWEASAKILGINIYNLSNKSGHA